MTIDSGQEQVFLQESIAEFAEAIRELKLIIESRGRVVDEYLTSGPVGTSVTQLEVLPQFQKLAVRIEHIIVTGPATGTATSQQKEGSLTSPGATTTIVSLNAPLSPGVIYRVDWSVALDGTVSATDVDNFNLTIGSTGLEQSINDGVVGSYPQRSVIVSEPASGVLTVAIKSIAAGTVGAVYSAQLALTPVSYTFALQLGDRYWPNLSLPPTGILELSPKCLLLNPIDRRILTATFPGPYTLELLGFADVRE